MTGPLHGDKGLRTSWRFPPKSAAIARAYRVHPHAIRAPELLALVLTAGELSHQATPPKR